MKIWYQHPSNIYFEAPTWNPFATSQQRIFRLFILRDTETGTETKFLSPYNTSYYYPYDETFLRDNRFQIFLEKSDGSYRSQLLVKTDSEGKRYGWPLQVKKVDPYSNQTFINSNLVSQFDCLDLITADGQYTIYYSSVGRSGTGTSTSWVRNSVLTAMNKNNMICVLTKTSDYGKQLGVSSTSGGSERKTHFLNDVKFWHSWEGFFSEYFTNPETNAREYRVVAGPTISTGYSRCCYTISGTNSIVWQSTETPPPEGYEQNYTLSGEEWNFSQPWNTYTNRVLRYPPWNGISPRYLFEYMSYSGSEPLLKLSLLSTVEYEENRWVIKDTSGKIIYENTTAPATGLDKTQQYHFDFIGELGENDDERIAQGIDFTFYRDINLLNSSYPLESLIYNKSLVPQAKQIVGAYKKETGFVDTYIYDQPYFI